MPAGSRITALVGSGSPLRSTRGLLPRLARLHSDRTCNGLLGGRITATVDAANARIRVELYWPGIRTASVVRVHADGTTVAVRDGEPATVCRAWAGWDWEAPLDAPVTYHATTIERDGAVCVSAAVTVPAQRDWLKHPTRPALNQPISIRSFEPGGRPARSAKLRPPLSKYVISVYGVRQANAGQVILQTRDLAEAAAVDALLDDNADLLLQRPADRGGQSWYVAIDSTGLERLDPDHPTLLVERPALPFEQADRPSGDAEGVAGGQLGDLTDDFQTINQVNAGHASYLDLSMRAS